MTQEQRILTVLRQRGAQGTTQADWKDRDDVVDGGSAITRLAARVRDLRDQGHRIVTAGARDGFTVYRLDMEAGSGMANAVFCERCVTYGCTRGHETRPVMLIDLTHPKEDQRAA